MISNGDRKNEDVRFQHTNWKVRLVYATQQRRGVTPIGLDGLAGTVAAVAGMLVGTSVDEMIMLIVLFLSSRASGRSHPLANRAVCRDRRPGDGVNGRRARADDRHRQLSWARYRRRPVVPGWVRTGRSSRSSDRTGEQGNHEKIFRFGCHRSATTTAAWCCT